MIYILKIADAPAVFLQNIHCRRAIIGGTINTIFLADMFQRKRAVVFEKIRSHGTGSGFQEIGKIFPVVDLLSEIRSEEHTSELQSRFDLVCRLLLEKKRITLAGESS